MAPTAVSTVIEDPIPNLDNNGACHSPSTSDARLMSQLNPNELPRCHDNHSSDVRVPLKHSRNEADSLGQRELPDDVLYGINTSRALGNFPLSGRTIGAWPEFIYSFATIKQAAAFANREIDVISMEQADAISSACEEIKSGRHREHFVIDALEGSGGTSTNMNVNEVIANIVAKRSGRALSDYSFVHPNDHVNIGQSTNDVVPSAMKLAVHRSLTPLLDTLRRLAEAFESKETEYAALLRLGRTCLQDAQPMTLGQALGGYAAVIRRHRAQIVTIQKQFLTLPLGGTAIGTGFGSAPGYKTAVFRHLSSLLGLQYQPVDNSFDGMQNMDTCARLSAELRNTGNSLWKIANDLILLSSGPNGGISEITLPSVQAGSSIMPGKVNPVIPIAVCQVAFAIFGNDAAISTACQQGMLEINHFELLVCDRLFDSIHLLKGAGDIFAKRCIEGLVANEQASLKHLLSGSALATALVPSLGYSKVSSIVRAATRDGRQFLDVVIDEGHLQQSEVLQLLNKSVYRENN